MTDDRLREIEARYADHAVIEVSVPAMQRAVLDARELIAEVRRLQFSVVLLREAANAARGI